MKKIFYLLLALIMVSGSINIVAAEESPSLFDKFFPIDQVYQADFSYSIWTEGEDCNLTISPQYYDELSHQMPPDRINRTEYYGHFIKVNYLGKYGEIDKSLLDYQLNLVDENTYLNIIGDPSAKPMTYKLPFNLTKDTIVVTIDLYDSNKKFVRNLSPSCVIAYTTDDGQFQTITQLGKIYSGLLFSNNADLLKQGSLKTARTIVNTSHTMISDKSMLDNFFAQKSVEDNKPYEFISQPSLPNAPQYMTNDILSGDEFVTPDGKYYKLSVSATSLEPNVAVTIDDVASYAKYMYNISPGYEQRNLLCKNGDAYAVTTKGEKTLIANKVKKVTKAHYMTNDGQVKSVKDNTVVATDCKDYDESYNSDIIGIIKNDNTFWMGYTYLSTAEAYARGLTKYLDDAKAVVRGGVTTSNNDFYKWTETLAQSKYDENAFLKGSLNSTTVGSLSLDKICSNTARVLDKTYVSKDVILDPLNNESLTGFVVTRNGYVYGYAPHNSLELGNLGLIERVFPIYSSDKGNFVALLSHDSDKPYGLIANHCTKMDYYCAQLDKPFMCQVAGGYKSTDGKCYAYDNDPDDLTPQRSFGVIPYGTDYYAYYDDDKNTFYTRNDETGEAKYLLPSVARIFFDKPNIALIERTDGSMWASRIAPRSAAANLAAKLGGFKAANPIQLTQATPEKVQCDFVDLQEGLPQPTANSRENTENAPVITKTATPTNSKIYIDGNEFAFDAYNIDGNNYFKLRDLAYAFNNTQSNFSVGYDDANNAITVGCGRPYTAVGNELSKGNGASKTATSTNSKIYINGIPAKLGGYNIDGNNYFKLRDICPYVDSTVDYDNTKNSIALGTGDDVCKLAIFKNMWKICDTATGLVVTIDQNGKLVMAKDTDSINQKWSVDRQGCALGLMMNLGTGGYITLPASGLKLVTHMETDNNKSNILMFAMDMTLSTSDTPYYTFKGYDDTAGFLSFDDAGNLTMSKNATTFKLIKTEAK